MLGQTYNYGFRASNHPSFYTNSVREWELVVEPNLLPFTTDPRRGYTSVKLANGMWFNTRARKDVTQKLAMQYASFTNTQIKELVQAEARKLQNFWRTKTPQYFNRRAYGMFFSKKKYPRRNYTVKKQPKGIRSCRHKKGWKIFNGPLITGTYLWSTRGTAIDKPYTNRQQFAGRHRTGQLRRALDVKKVSSNGCTLIVKPCYASTGKKVDYINVLMHGAHPSTGRPYVPELDRRVKARLGRYGGISSTYWKRWQWEFEIQLKKANDRLNERVAQLLVKNKHLEQSDARRVLNNRKTEKNIEKEKKKKRNRKGVSGVQVVPNSPYNKGRMTRNRGSYNRYTKRTPWEYKSNPYLRR